MPTENRPAELPRFVIADDGANRDFVIHLHPPRFVLEIGKEEFPVWLDPKPDEELNSTLLLQEASKFFLSKMADFKSQQKD